MPTTTRSSAPETCCGAAASVDVPTGASPPPDASPSESSTSRCCEGSSSGIRSPDRDTYHQRHAFASPKEAFRRPGAWSSRRRRKQDRARLWTPQPMFKSALATRPAEGVVMTEAVPSMQVLVVEDDPDVADGLAIIFKLLGHRCHTAASATDGLAAASAHSPD